MRRAAQTIVRFVAAFVVVVAVAIGIVPSAFAHARSVAPRVYHPTFKRVAGTELLSGSGWVAIYGSASAPNQVQLINTVTGRAVTTTQPGCIPDAVGGNWLALTCQSGYRMSYALYDILDNRALPFTPASAITSPACSTGCQSVAGIGTDWIALTAPCGDPSKCPSTFDFENLTTGATRTNPTNRSTRIDLNTAALSEAVCRPLVVPQDNQQIEDGTYRGWGSVTVDDGYGIEAGGSGVFLQRCGSRIRTLLTRTATTSGCAARACPAPSNQNLVVWQSAAGRLGGIFLKHLERFQITVPARVDPAAHQLQFVRADLYTLALTTKTLYLKTPSGTVWAAPAPQSSR